MHIGVGIRWFCEDMEGARLTSAVFYRLGEVHGVEVPCRGCGHEQESIQGGRGH